MFRAAIALILSVFLIGVSADAAPPANGQPKAAATSPDTASAAGKAYDDGILAIKAQDYQKAAGLFAKACDGGKLAGCSSLGVVYLSGQGVVKDPARAVSLLNKACDGGYLLGCSSLGTLYLSGQGELKDPERAASLFEKACNGGNVLGCYNLAPLSSQTKCNTYNRCCHVKLHPAFA